MIPCYVITLDDSFPAKNHLIRLGLNPILFKGINGKKDEHLGYMGNVSVPCQYTCPKSIIGSGLSHILLAKKLYEEEVPIALILEDDAYPKVSKLDIEQIISEVPDDWDIIKLHCNYCINGSNESVITDGSIASYIINRKGMYKLKNLHIMTYLDSQIAFTPNIKMYKTLYNLFWTDEEKSGA